DVSSSIAMIISPAIGGFFAALFGIKFVFLLSFLSYLISTSFIFLIEEDRNIYRNFSNVENGMNSKWEKKIRPMQDYLPLLQDKKFLRICMLFSLVFLSIYISHPFVPIYIYDVYKMPMSLIGVLGTASALGGVAISLLFSRIADRINKYRAIAFLLLISFISTLMLILSANFTILLFTFFLSGSAFSFYGIMSGLVVTKVSKQNSGKAFAVLETVTGIPVIIAPIIGSILYSYAPILPILATIIISLIVILILFFIPFLD
ncbi:MAG: MFS transporter, partial [Thermoplasmata archaeon]